LVQGKRHPVTVRERVGGRLLTGVAPVVFLLLWSGGFTAVRVGLADTGPLTFLVLRYMLVLVVLAPLALLLRPPLPAGRAAWGHLVVVAVLVQVLYFALVNVAFELGASTAGVALIVSLQPVLVALAAPSITGERVGASRWAGLALGLVGAALVIATRGDIRASPTGVLAALVAVLAISAGTIYERRFGLGEHVVTANLVQYAVGLLALLPAAFLAEGMRFHATPRLGLALAYLGLGNSLVSVTLLFAMVRRGEAARVSALFFLVPPLAALIALLVLHEAVPALAWVGMVLAALGVALATRRSAPAPQPPD
jgi:drug/metabolite transporter (DMT)-like permease